MALPDGAGPALPRLSRRGLLIGGALGLGALAAACRGSTPSSGGSSIDTFSAVLQGSGAGEGIDPGVNHQFVDEARMKAMYDGLFAFDNQMRPVPRLAETAEPNADGTTWRIRLRDARWHDGRKLTSADVLYTFSRILGPTHTKPFIAATTLAQIDLSQSRAVDDRTVEVTLRRPSFELPSALSGSGTKIVQNGARDFTRPVGTGPFRFESFSPGKQLVATAYDDHWDGAPKIRRLKILSVDPDARLTALQGGQADFADDLTPSAVKTLRGAGGVTVNTTADSGVEYFAMKTDRPPFDNPDVRRALMRMVDRDELVRVALEGQADAGNDVFGTGYQYFAGDLPPHRFDPEAAKSLLARAGAADPGFDLYTAQAASGFVEAAHLVAEQARRCGVTANVVLGSKDTYYTDSMSTGALTMGQAGPMPVRNHFAERLVTGAPQNRTHWSDAEFDALFARAEATPSEDERVALYHRMHEVLHDRGPLLCWANLRRNNAAKSTFKGVPAGVPNSLDWARFDKVSL